MRGIRVLGALGAIFIVSSLAAGISQRVSAENVGRIEFAPIFVEDTVWYSELEEKVDFELHTVYRDEDYEESVWAEMAAEEDAAETAPVIESTEEEYEEPGDVIEFRVMSVNGAVLDQDLQLCLFNALKEHELEWFMPWALCQAYQESRFDPYAVSPNGMDKGLFQFREIYWTWFQDEYGVRGDIFDAKTQIRMYVENVAKWYAETGDLNMVISAHYTGSCEYNAEYVATVLGWMQTVIR